MLLIMSSSPIVTAQGIVDCMTTWGPFILTKPLIAHIPTLLAFENTKAIDAIDISGNSSLEFGGCLSKYISCTCNSNWAVPYVQS